MISLAEFPDYHRDHVFVVQIEGLLRLTLPHDIGVVLVLDDLLDGLQILAFVVSLNKRLSYFPIIQTSPTRRVLHLGVWVSCRVFLCLVE